MCYDDPNGGIALIYLLSALVALCAIGLDQWTKYATVATLALGERRPLLPGIVRLTYVRNDGMSFSLFGGARWVFVVLTILVLAFALFAVWRKWVRHPLGLLSLAAVFGGAVGNLIDRIRLGYVVDMIELEFIRFAVFNVADIFITVGGVLFCIWAIFFWKDPKPGEEAPHAPDR